MHKPLSIFLKVLAVILGLCILEGLCRSIFALSISPVKFGILGYTVREILILNGGILTLILPCYLWICGSRIGEIRSISLLFASTVATVVVSLILTSVASELFFLNLLSLSLYDLLGILGGGLGLWLIQTFGIMSLGGGGLVLLGGNYLLYKTAFTLKDADSHISIGKKASQKKSNRQTQKNNKSQSPGRAKGLSALVTSLIMPYLARPLNLSVIKGHLIQTFAAWPITTSSKLWEKVRTPLSKSLSRRGKGFKTETDNALASDTDSLAGAVAVDESFCDEAFSSSSRKSSGSIALFRSPLKSLSVIKLFRRSKNQESLTTEDPIASQTKRLTHLAKAASTALAILKHKILYGALGQLKTLGLTFYSKFTNLSIFTPKFEKDYVGSSAKLQLGIDYQEIFSKQARSRASGTTLTESANKDSVESQCKENKDAVVDDSLGNSIAPQETSASEEQRVDPALSSYTADDETEQSTSLRARHLESPANDSRGAATHDSRSNTAADVKEETKFGEPVQTEQAKKSSSSQELEICDDVASNPIFNPEPAKYESPKLFSWIKTNNNPLISTHIPQRAEKIPTSPIRSAPSPTVRSNPKATSLSRQIERVEKTLNEGFALDLLSDFPSSYASTTHFNSNEEVDENGMQILEQLQNFGVGGDIIARHQGPVVSLYEFRPSKGVKVAKITGLQDELAMKLRATSVRIIAPLPGQDAVGIEVPNREQEIVGLKEILRSDDFLSNRSPLTIALGKDSYGRPAVQDIAKMPHLLIAGATGTGKSVSINALLLSLLFKSTPDDINLVLIDPKILELSVYEGIPHLKVPVITDCKKARAVLEWAVKEMERRYKLMQRYGVRNVDAFNKVLHNDELDEQQPLPKIVIVIDELADLMFQVGKDLEELIARLAQKARASGIHLVLATQRPSVDVITGLIKANFPVRISFRVTSRIDSRTILDTQGADKLLGRGDMLLSLPGVNNLIRCHGAYVTDDDVRLAVDNLKDRWGPPEYDPYVVALCEKAVAEEEAGGDNSDDEEDPMYEEALRVVIKKGTASTSMIQRALRIGYNRAARIIDMMEDRGVIGPQDGAKPREIFMNVSEEIQE